MLLRLSTGSATLVSLARFGGWRMKLVFSALLVLTAFAAALSQTPETPPPGSPATSAADGSTSSILPDLDQLQSVASQTAQDLGKLHIEKWKANSTAKNAAQADAESVQRNLTSALPGMIAAARATPDDLNAQFKLYRNLNALYDVFGEVADATRVYGQKGQYDTLSQQLQEIGSLRRKLGESLEQSTASAQRELNQMRVQIKDQQEQLAAAQAATAEARRELLLAQTAPPPKPPPKKKPVAKKPAAAGSPNVNPSNSNSSGQTGGTTSPPKG